MNFRVPARRHWMSCVAGALLLGCGDHALIGPEPDLELRAARPTGGGGGGPTVKSASPSSGPRGTTLSVRILGSGYSAGSKASWALNGDTAFAITKVRVNSTTFISSSELVASISIDEGAALDLFDILVVTPTGKKGIGIELFEVTVQIIDLGAGEGSFAEAVNDAGQIVGWGGSGGAFLWENGVLRSLGVLPGMTWSSAFDINNSGQVVGASSAASGTQTAFVWTAADGMVPLPGSLGGTRSFAWAINDNGDVVGEATLLGDSIYHAVLWRNGAMIDLQASTFGGGSSRALDINELGEIVGDYDGVSQQRAFRWTAASGMQLILPLVGGGEEAIGIGSSGTIVGWSSLVASGPLIAYVWTNGALQHLGTLGGSSSVAMASNNAGTVVGRADTGSRKGGTPQQLAFFWTAGTGMKALPMPAGRTSAWAFDINENDWIVGASKTSGGNYHATLWQMN